MSLSTESCSMATDDSGERLLVVSTAAAQSYSSVNLQPHQTFLVVGNVPSARLYSGTSSSNHPEAAYIQSGYTIGFTASGSGDGTQTIAKQNSRADRILEDKSRTISSSVRKVKSDLSRKRLCKRPALDKFQCSECGEVSSSSTDLTNHLDTHHKNHIQTFKCLYCSQIFFSRCSVVQHIKSVLMAKKPSPTHVAGMISCVKHTCPVCSHVHVSAQHLKVHLLKSECGESGTRPTTELLAKNTKLDCIRAVLQAYKPTTVTHDKDTADSVKERDVINANDVITSTNSSSCGTGTTTSYPNRNTPLETTRLPGPDKGQCSVLGPPCNVLEHSRPCPPPPTHFYPPPTTYIRAPLVMSLSPTQYYNLDYYQYPATNMAPAHHLPPQYNYLPRANCPAEPPLLEKHLYSCLHCGSKFPEFDMLARHFRENTCNSAAHGSLEGIVSCCPEPPY